MISFKLSLPIFIIAFLSQLIVVKMKYIKIFGDNTVWFEIDTADDYIKFKANVPHNSYFAIGFGSGMKDTDMIAFQANKDQSAVVDLWSTGHVMPVEDDSQDIAMTRYILKNHVQFTARRKFDTGDLKDYVIKKNTTINMIAAWVTTGYNLSYHGLNYEFFDIKVDTNGTVTEYIDSGKYDFFKQHGWLMWTAWGVLSMIQFISNRYMKMYWYINMWIHRLTGTTILAITLVYGILAIQKAGFQSVPGGHTLFGLIVFFTVGCVALWGVFTRSMLNRLQWRTRCVLRIKSLHKIFGYFVIWCAQTAILTGGIFYSSIDNKTNPFVISHFVLFFIASVFCESLYRKFKDMEMPYKEIHNLISIEKFQQRVAGGEQLVIIDDMVLDVSRFQSNHPGGKFALQHNIGNDISKFFYGGYSLESLTVKPHRHSNAARHIVNGLIVGRLESRASIFSARIISKTEVNSTTKVFTLRAQASDSNFRLPLSTDIQSFGKHILIKSYNQIERKRHYTLAVCMKGPIYKEYVKAIEQFRKGSNIEFNNQVLQENSIDDAEVVIVCKNYEESRGLSFRLHTSEYELYQIKALMGKGLGISRDGTHIAFVAGTGVLPFMDLIAYLVRYNLDLLTSNEQSLLDHHTFKFVLYASFHNKEEGVGIQLIEGLHEITQKKNLGNFELLMRYTNEIAYRWDEQFIKRQIEIHKGQDIKKIWVCGPPRMNELFDRSLETMADTYKLKKHLIEIL